MKSQIEFIQYHLNRISVIQAAIGTKKLFVECFPTDEGAKVFPNSNFAIKEIHVNDPAWDRDMNYWDEEFTKDFKYRLTLDEIKSKYLITKKQSTHPEDEKENQGN